jgi:hypothetical protein
MSVRITGVSAEIRTDDILNTRLEHQSYAIPLYTKTWEEEEEEEKEEDGKITL